MRSSEIVRPEDIYQSYEKLMFSVAGEILSDLHYKEDAVQQCMLKLISNMHKLDPSDEKSMRNYICSACYTAAVDIYNRNLKNCDVMAPDEIDIEVDNNPETIVLSEESIAKVSDAIVKLPKKYRSVITLAYEQRSRNEISEMLGLNPETVKKRLARARQMIAKSLEKEVSEQ